MVKIWAKIINDNKIVRSIIYTHDSNYDTANFLTYLIDICYELDIPTPIILKSHTHNFYHFNIAKFRTPDFVESINFDTLLLENAAD